MESKTSLKLKLRLGNGGNSTPEALSPSQPTESKMTDEEMEPMVSDDDAEADDAWPDEKQTGKCMEEEDESLNKSHNFHDDGARERHKKSKKKKKKKEKERERHKHKHHRGRTEEEEELPAKRLMVSFQGGEQASKGSPAALKELLEALLSRLQKKDPQNYFSFPVTDAIAPGYSSIISQPMDFAKMQEKLQDGIYEHLSEFRDDLFLICNNCMLYNQTDTVFYKAAKRLHQSGEKLLSPGRIMSLKSDIPSIQMLSINQLGFDVNSEIPILDTEEGSQDSNRSSDNENSQNDTSKLEALQDELSGSDILEQAQSAAKEAADKLTLKKPESTLGFLRQRKDGTTTLNFLTGCEGSDPNVKEKPISLGLLTGKLTQGSSSLHNYKDDKRSLAKPVKPLYYGSFSSFCPSYDSTFANLSKEESEMVYATYGNETAVQYAESICDFSRDCDMAMHLVDQLLNLLTHQQHSRTKSFIEERRRIQLEDQKIQSLLINSPQEGGVEKSCAREISPNFSTLKTLKDIGIDTSFLSTFECLEQREQMVGAKLSQNANLLADLAKEQKERLSKPLQPNLNNLTPPSESELKLAEKVTEGLISVARQIPPGALAPVPIVRRALGITMMPVKSDSTNAAQASSVPASESQVYQSKVFTSEGGSSASSNLPTDFRGVQANSDDLPSSELLTDKNFKEIFESS